MSIILQTIIAVITVIALFSIANSFILEGVRIFTKRRAKDLQHAILQLLAKEKASVTDLMSNRALEKSNQPVEADDKNKLGKELLSHSFILKLREGEGGNQLSWIPSDVFAETFINLVVTKGKTGKEPTEVKAVMDSFENGIEQLPKNLQPALIQLFRYVKDQKGDELTTLKQKVAGFYDAYMDRVTASYRKKTKFWLFGIGILLSGSLNLDLIKIVQTMVKNDDLRVEYYELGKTISKNEVQIDTSAIISYLADNMQNLDAQDLIQKVASSLSHENDTIAFVTGKSKLPIGWARGDLTKKSLEKVGFRNVVLKVLGIIFMAIALAFGAPFWFDLLKKATMLDTKLNK